MPLRYRENLKCRGRILWSNLTDAEKLLWSKLRKRQVKNLQFNRQKPIGKYIVDFYCDKVKLVIEVDGGQHYEVENIVRDKEREIFLKNLNLKVVRFTNLDILKNIDSVIEKIYSEF